MVSDGCIMSTFVSYNLGLVDAFQIVKRISFLTFISLYEMILGGFLKEGADGCSDSGGIDRFAMISD